MKKAGIKDFCAFLFFLCITLFFTCPALFSFKTRFLGFGRDFSLFVWNVWWFEHAISVLHKSPFYTDYIFYPFGEGLFLQVFSIPHCVLVFCLRKCFSFVVSWNIHYLISMLLPALSMYVLAYHLFRSRVTAVIAALIFGFCPWMTLHYQGFIIESSSVFTLPLFFYTLLRSQEKPSPWWKLLAATVWALALYTCLWTAVYLTVFFIIYQLYVMLRNRPAFVTHIKSGLMTVLFFLILASPLIYGVATQIAMEGGGDVHWIKIDLFSVDPGSFFLPAQNHTFWGKVDNPFVAKENVIENTAFTGYTVILLFLLALFKYRELGELRLLVWTFIVFFVLSLGPSLHLFGFTGERFFGVRDLGGARITIPLPYALFYYIPILKQLRWPGRFIIGMELSIALLACWYINNHILKSGWSKLQRLAIAGLITAVLVFEFLPIPFPSTSAAYPRELRIIRDDPEACTVLFIPMELMSGPYKVGFHTGEDMLYQVYHQKRLVSGFLGRVPLKKLKTLANTRIIKTILLTQHIDQPQVGSNILDFSAEMKNLPGLMETDRQYVKPVVTLLGIKYIILMQPGNLPNTAAYIESLFQPFKIVDTATMRIYKIDAGRL